MWTDPRWFIYQLEVQICRLTEKAWENAVHRLGKNGMRVVHDCGWQKV